MTERGATMRLVYPEAITDRATASALEQGRRSRML